ncbi:MAG: hypothetical protein HRU32_16785 [Rhodobacteraceae bacterium]|nr:hypothetical protein [Paracoccaceae bacterium]
MAFVDFEGKAMFAKVFERNRDMGENLPDGDQKNKIALEQGHYVMNVKITPETKQQMISEGVPTKGMVGQLFKEDDEGNLFYKCKRPHFNPRINKGEGGVMGAPTVMDSNNDPWDSDVNIGNGSDVKVRLDVWEKKIVTMHAVKVLQLEEFVADNTGLAGF